jgi:ADP-ribose pyrophosphatase YjhB (NUDIX family)
MAEHLWLEWVKSLRAISQTGLHFSRDPFDTERYQQVREIASRILEQQSNLSRQQIVELDASDLGYATPKVDVRGAVFQDGRILLVREISDHGRWTLPGGWADPNETPSEAVAREVREESGYLTRVRKLVGLYDRDRQGLVPPYPYHIYKHFFLCEIVGGAAMGSVETSEVAFFAEDELPELSVARVSAHLIRRCFAHHRQPELATDFD